MSGQLNGSVLNAFAVLNLFTDARPVVTTQDVSRELGMNSVTAYRFLRSLEVAGAIVSFQRGQYRLGPALVDLGERAASADSIAALLQPSLNKLSDELGETSIATTFRKGRVELVARALSPRPYAMNLPVGSFLEPHCTANGKMWLATLRQDELERFMDSYSFAEFTPQTITDKTALAAEVEKVKQKGYATCIREREEEVSAVGAPLYSGSGKMIAGISIFGPSWRFTEDFISEAVGKIRLEADKLQRNLDAEVERQDANLMNAR